MFSFEQQMKKYFTLICITIGILSFAQFTENVFAQDQATADQQALDKIPNEAEATQTFTPVEEEQSSLIGAPGPGDQEEGPGNPGNPVPINGYIPVLLAGALSLIIYYQRKNRKINI